MLSRYVQRNPHHRARSRQTGMLTRDASCGAPPSLTGRLLVCVVWGSTGESTVFLFSVGEGCRAACRDIELPIFNPVQHAAIVGNRIKILPNHPPPAATTASAWYYSTSFWTHHRVEFGAVPLLLLTDVLLRHCLVMGMWVCTFAVVAKNGRQDRVTHFFETLAPELQSQPEWREWFGTEPNHTSDSFTYMLGQN